MFNKIDTIVMAEKQKAMQTKIINKNGWLTVNIVFFFAFVIGLSVCSWVEAAQQINNKTEIEGIEGFSFRWDNDQSGGYTLSIKNKLEYPITNVMVMVVFYDHAGNIVDYQELDFSLILPTGLSKRIRGKVDSSTLEIVNEIDPVRVPNFRGREAAIKWLENRKQWGPKSGWIEIKVLDFKKYKQDK